VFPVIVVLGRFDLAPEDRDRFIDSKRAQVEHTLTEAGCLDYGFSLDARDAGRVRLTERWESMAALTAHVTALRAAPPADPGPRVVSHEITVIDGEPVEGLFG
jgi:quinol monooxygenase YgiN